MPFGTGGADTNLLAKLAAQTTDERLKRIGKAYLIKDVSQFSKVFEFVSASVGAAMNQGGTADVTMSPDVAQQVTVPIDLS